MLLASTCILRIQRKVTETLFVVSFSYLEFVRLGGCTLLLRFADGSRSTVVQVWACHGKGLEPSVQLLRHEYGAGVPRL